MAGIQEYLEQIKGAVYGREVRQAIHDGIEECYNDGKAGAIDLLARQQIEELVAPSGEAPSAAEVTDARIDKNGTAYSSLGTAIRAQDISVIGINLFDKSRASIGKVINLLGGVETNSSFFCSDFIPVLPDTDYDLLGVGSASSYLSAAFYDSSKTFLSGSFHASRERYTLTTPSTCAFVRINGIAANVDTGYFVRSNENPSAFSPYRRIIDGISNNGISLLSSHAIRYNYESGELYSASNIFLRTQEKVISLGESISVGQGAYLYWSKATGALVASSTYPINDNNVYLVCQLLSEIYERNNGQSGVTSWFPIFEYDMTNNVLHIRTMSYPAVIFDKGSAYTIPSNYEQDIEFATPNAFIYYDPKNEVFGTTQGIGTIIDNGYIYIAFKGYSYVESNFPYSILTNEKSLAKKSIMTWGDSLTYYDGQEYSWGEHEGEICIGYQSYMKNYLGLVVTQLGMSGKTTPEICNAIMNNSLDFTAYDYMTIMSGDNDDRLSVPIGTLLPVGSQFDVTTVIGALQGAVEYSLTQNPKLRIIIMSEPMGWTYVNGAMKRVSSLIPNALKQVAEQYGLPFVDLWSESGINEMNRVAFYADPAPSDNHMYMYHPNNDGWKLISKVICNKILDY